MNQLVFVLHNPALGKTWLKTDLIIGYHFFLFCCFLKHEKVNTAFLDDIFIISSPFHLSEITYVISSFNLRTKPLKLIPDAMIIP